MPDDIIARIGLGQLPRMAGLVDREAHSANYGCADRNYWHYKVIDFSNARMQETALAFALAYQINLPGNRFYNNRSVKAWAYAAADFWAKTRHRDGTVDESYPAERHFCATAFGLWAVTQLCAVLEEPLRWDLSASGNFLLGHGNPDVSNQTAAAAAALYNLWVFTGRKEYDDGWQSKIEALRTMQSSCGAFLEYGGFDLGYDTITISFLAQLHSQTGQPYLKEMALRCIGHLEPYVDGLGTYDEGKMSRRTQFIYPSGLKYFGAQVYDRLCKGLASDAVLNPAWMDDRYAVALTCNYLLCAASKGGQ